MFENGVMSIGDAVAVLAFFGTVLASTWHLSAKLQQLISDGRTSRALLDTHILDYRTKVLEIEMRLKALEHGRIAHPPELV